jgi:hypothetical protein
VGEREVAPPLETVWHVIASPVTALILGLIGLLFGYIFYRLGRRAKLLCWAIRSNTLIRHNQAQFPGLAVTYNGHAVETLVVTKVMIWNAGTDTVDRNDIATADPLRILASPGVEVLHATVLATNSPAGQAALAGPLTTRPMSEVQVTFDFLDRGQGMTVQAIHTGSEDAGVTVTGTVKGAGQPRRRDLRDPVSTRRGAYGTAALLAFSSAATCVITYVTVLTWQVRHAVGRPLSPALVMLFLGPVVLAVIFLLGIAVSDLRALRQRPPQGLPFFERD